MKARKLIVRTRAHAVRGERPDQRVRVKKLRRTFPPSPLPLPTLHLPSPPLSSLPLLPALNGKSCPAVVASAAACVIAF